MLQLSIHCRFVAIDEVYNTLLWDPTQCNTGRELRSTHSAADAKELRFGLNRLTPFFYLDGSTDDLENEVDMILRV